MSAKRLLISGIATGVVALFFVSGCNDGGTPSKEISSTQKAAVLKTYADIAEANYEKVLSDAEALKAAIDTFATNPTADNFTAAKTAWKTARESYGTTEVFRLSNTPIDAEGDG